MVAVGSRQKGAVAMLRASVTVFYGLIFHEEGSDAEFGDVIWGPLDRDEVHCTDEAAVSAGELLGATKPTVPFNNRDPKVTGRVGES